MAKELKITITEDQTIGGETVEVTTHTIVRAVPNHGNLPRYVRLHDLVNNTTYIWSGDPFEVDGDTSTDNPNWILE